MVEVEQLYGVDRHRMTFLIEEVSDCRLITVGHHVVHASLALATRLLRCHRHIYICWLVHGELILLLLQLLELFMVRALQVLRSFVVDRRRRMRLLI